MSIELMDIADDRRFQMHKCLPKSKNLADFQNWHKQCDAAFCIGVCYGSSEFANPKISNSQITNAQIVEEDSNIVHLDIVSAESARRQLERGRQRARAPQSFPFPAHKFGHHSSSFHIK